MSNKLKDVHQAVDMIADNFGTVLFLRGVETKELLPYEVTKEMYVSGKRNHIVEQVLQSEVGEPFELKIIYRLLLYIRNACDSGKLLRFTFHQGRVISISGVIKPEKDKRVYITVAYSPYSGSSYGELYTSDLEKGRDSNGEDKKL